MTVGIEEKCGAVYVGKAVGTQVNPCDREKGHAGDHRGYQRTVDECAFWPQEGDAGRTRLLELASTVEAARQFIAGDHRADELYDRLLTAQTTLEALAGSGGGRQDAIAELIALWRARSEQDENLLKPETEAETRQRIHVREQCALELEAVAGSAPGDAEAWKAEADKLIAETRASAVLTADDLATRVGDAEARSSGDQIATSGPNSPQEVYAAAARPSGAPPRDEQPDEEMVPHEFVQRGAEPHWCGECEYHCDHPIHGGQAEAAAPRPSSELEEGDELHTGDDALLDKLTGIRCGLDELLEGEHGTLKPDQLEAIEGIYEHLKAADDLRVAELKANQGGPSTTAPEASA